MKTANSNANLGTLRVVCSCGRETLIVWSESTRRYFAQELDWEYHESRGWHCPLTGHSMARLGTMNKADYREALRRVEEGESRVARKATKAYLKYLPKYQG